MPFSSSPSFKPNTSKITTRPALVILLSVVLSFFAMTGFLFALIFLFGERLSESTLTAAILFVQSCIFIGLPVLVILKSRLSWADLGFLKPTRKNVIIAVLLAFLIQGISELMAFFMGNELEILVAQTLKPPGLTLTEAVFIIITVSILAPVGEEILFRGVLLNWLKNLMGFWPALIISSLVFGLIHLELAWILFATITGLLLGWLYHWSGSIWPAILCHITTNTLGITIIYLSY